MNVASGVGKFIVAALALLAIASCAKQSDQLGLANAGIPSSQHGAALGNCSDPCTIQSNNGGVIADFENAGDAIRAGARHMLVIDGYCASACMVLADRARPRACITPRAQFVYHETNYNRPLPLRADLHGWIMRHGGFPSYNGMAVMPNDAAQKFWPLCPLGPPQQTPHETANAM